MTARLLSLLDRLLSPWAPPAGMDDLAVADPPMHA
jgi:hypothetical protein